MNLQKFRMRNSQKQTTLVHQKSPLEMLQAEADKVHKWQLKVELQLKEKDREIQASKQTIDSMRNAILDSKIENDKKAKQLQEEIKSHDLCLKKCEATREMCFLIKDEFQRLEKILHRCEESANHFHNKSDKQKMLIQKLTDDLSAMGLSMKEAGETWETEYSKFVDTTRKQAAATNAELGEVKFELQNAKDNVASKLECMSKLKAELADSQNYGRQLMKTRSGLQETVIKLLQTIGQMKTVNEFAVNDLRAQLSEATDLVEDKSEVVRDLNEQYVCAKQTWQKCEEEYLAVVKRLESEVETLTARCEELQIENEDLAKELKNSITGNELLEEKLAGVIANADQLAMEKENLLQALQNELQENRNSKEALLLELESYRNLSEHNLENKEKEIQSLSSEIKNLKEHIANSDENLKIISDELTGSDKEAKTKQKKIEKLEKDVSKLEEKIEQLTSQADEAKQLRSDLAKMREDSASEAKKMKKSTDSCKQLEKKAKEALKGSREELANALKEADALKEEVKVKENELKCMKKMQKEHEKIKEEKERLSTKLEEKEAKYREEIVKLTDKTTLLGEQQLKDNQTIREREEDVKFFRQHLKDTEKMLSDEGEKLVARNEEIEKQRGKIKDLEHELKKMTVRNTDLQKELEKDKEVKFSECSVSPSSFPHKKTRPIIRVPQERKESVKKANQLPEPKYPTRKRSVQDFLLEDTDDMLSEVSFGSGVVDVTLYPKRQTLASSTPKLVGRAFNRKQLAARKTNQRPVNVGEKSQNYVKKTNASYKRKPKQVKKEVKKENSLDWFETDSVYGFHD